MLITAEQTPTYTSTVRSGGTVRGIGNGTVRIGLVVGDCPGYKSGSDAYTGYNSVARIMIEEVPVSVGSG